MNTYNESEPSYSAFIANWLTIYQGQMTNRSHFVWRNHQFLNSYSSSLANLFSFHDLLTGWIYHDNSFDGLNRQGLKSWKTIKVWFVHYRPHFFALFYSVKLWHIYLTGSVSLIWQNGVVVEWWEAIPTLSEREIKDLFFLAKFQGKLEMIQFTICWKR